MGQDYCPVHEIPENRHKLAVVAGLEVLPGEVIVLCLRGIGTEDITQHVLLSRELLQILVEPHRPVLGCGYLVPFQVQELVCRDIVREDKVPVGLQHGREDNAVEDDIVLPDEMHKPGILRFPPFLPALGKELFGVGYISDRGIEPYIEHLAFSTLDRHRDTPVKVTAHCSRLESAVDPGLALPVDIGPPLLMPFEDPFLEPRLVLVQRKIPVPGLLLDRSASAQGGMRVQELVRAECAAAFLALVAVCALVAAFRAGPDDVAVGKEGICLCIKILLALLLDEFAFVIQPAEEIRGCLCMDF